MAATTSHQSCLIIYQQLLDLFLSLYVNATALSSWTLTTRQMRCRGETRSYTHGRWKQFNVKNYNSLFFPFYFTCGIDIFKL